MTMLKMSQPLLHHLSLCQCLGSLVYYKASRQINAERCSLVFSFLSVAKCSCVADESKASKAATGLPKEDVIEPRPAQLQLELHEPAAPQPPAVKIKKKKHRHSTQPASDAQPRAVESPADLPVADAAALESVLASQAVPDPNEPGSQNAEAKPKKEKKHKKKKHRQSEDAAGPSQITSAENAAVLPTVVQYQPEVPNAQQPIAQTLSEELAAAKPKKKKRKHQHSDADDTGRQPAAASAAVANAPTAQPGLGEGPTDDLGAEVPAVKPKKKKKHKPRDDAASSEQLQTIAVEVPVTAAASVPASELQEPVPPASATATAKPKKRKHKEGANKGKELKASDPSKPTAAAAVVNDAIAQEGELPAAADGVQPAVKPKRKRKSKAALPDDPVAASAPEAPSEAPAAAEAAQAPKARKRKAVQTTDPNSSSAVPIANSWRADLKRTDVKKGKFTKQEKDTLKQAALSYAQEHGLATDDFTWLFGTRTAGNRKEVAGAWQAIAQTLPHRTYKSVYACGTRMLHELNYQVKILCNSLEHMLSLECRSCYPGLVTHL